MSGRKPHAETEIVEETFLRLANDAQGALNRLDDLWTKLYGPNEALRDAHDALLALHDTFYGDDEDRCDECGEVWPAHAEHCSANSANTVTAPVQVTPAPWEER